MKLVSNPAKNHEISCDWLISRLIAQGFKYAYKRDRSMKLQIKGPHTKKIKGSQNSVNDIEDPKR